jgi:hypothetical protein
MRNINFGQAILTALLTVAISFIFQKVYAEIELHRIKKSFSNSTSVKSITSDSISKHKPCDNYGGEKCRAHAILLLQSQYKGFWVLEEKYRGDGVFQFNLQDTTRSKRDMLTVEIKPDCNCMGDFIEIK